MPDKRIVNALAIAMHYGGSDDGHQLWVVDQMVRALTGCPMIEKTKLDARGNPYTFEAQGESSEYLEFVRIAMGGKDGPETYEWETGVAP